MSLNDYEVIGEFVSFIGKVYQLDLHIDNCPDRENRKGKDIDAIAGNFAIEHTSIDTLPHQRRDSIRFMKAVGGLQKEIFPLPPFRLRITLDYDAIKKGQNWGKVRAAIKKWVTEQSLHPKDGHHVICDIPDIPFCFHVIKYSDRPPAIKIGRLVPIDDTLSIRIRELFTKKAEKLAKYHNMIKILLVESEDGSLMNECDMLVAISNAFPNGLPPGVDQLWYADTSIPERIEFFDLTEKLKRNLP